MKKLLTLWAICLFVLCVSLSAIAENQYLFGTPAPGYTDSGEKTNLKDKALAFNIIKEIFANEPECAGIDIPDTFQLLNYKRTFNIWEITPRKGGWRCAFAVTWDSEGNSHYTIYELTIDKATPTPIPKTPKPTTKAVSVTNKPTITSRPNSGIPQNLLSVTYQLGDNTNEILQIKKRMQLLGYFTAGAELSGNYNSLIQERIRQFQRDYGLSQTGTIDKTFLEALYGSKAEAAIQKIESEMTEAQKAANYKASCRSYDYTDVARNPNKYEGTKVKVSGKVIQVMEDSSLGVVYTALRVQESRDKVWYVTMFRLPNESRVLENDRVTLYGEFNGLKTYTTVMGASITIPSMFATFIEIR